MPLASLLPVLVVLAPFAPLAVWTLCVLRAPKKDVVHIARAFGLRRV